MDNFNSYEKTVSNYEEQLVKEEEEIRKELARPLTTDDFPKMNQLQIDCINVQEKRIDILSFSKERQTQINNYYRFTPINVESINASASVGGRNSWK